MRHFKLFIISIIGFVMFAFLFFGTVGVALYKFNSESRIVKGAARLLPYPVARIDSHFIKFSDYWFDLDTLMYFYNNQKDTAGMPVPNEKSVRQNVLDRLARNYILEQLAKEKAISVSRADIEAEYKNISDENQGEENLKKLLEQYYNWTPEIFKARVIFYSLLSEKLINVYGSETAFNKAVKDKMASATVKKYIDY